MQLEKGYISLKQAAELSGYSPDYIGQLIRGGKLSGKQVYTNVAWVTTEDSIREYMETRGKPVEASTTVTDDPDIRIGVDGLAAIEKLDRMYALFSWAVIGVLAVFVSGLMYVLAVTVDHSIEQSHLEKITYVQ